MVDKVEVTPEGGSAGPEELTPDNLALFTSQFSSFSDVVGKLRDAYGDLFGRYASLQEELERTNHLLRATLREHAATSDHLQSILTSISSGVISVDLEGRITHYNAAAERIFGLEAAAVLGQLYRDVLPVDAPCADGALRSPHAVRDGEKLYTDPAGRTRPLAAATSLLTDAEGKVQGAVEIVNDLSRLRSLETEVMRVRTLAALGEMAATVAHEIRNPLAGIAGFAGLLARDLAPADPKRTHAEKIIRGCENLNRIVTNLLQYASPLRLERRQCDLVSEVAEAITLFEQQLSEHDHAITIRREFACPELVGHVDPVQLRLAVHNLLQNAADATGQGEIACGISVVPDAADRRDVCLWVADNGPGIPEVHRERVFTPFFTTKDKGTGLGLATVRKVMDAHRGRVELTTPAEGGVQFKLWIPVREQ